MTARRGAGAGVRQLHLGVELPLGGEGGGTGADFESWAALARVAERGLFDVVLLAGERGCGPEPVTVLHALAAVTGRIGLAVALPGAGAGREPYDLARRIAVLDRLSGGRAGGPPVRFCDPSGAQARPALLDLGGTPEVLLTGLPPGGRHGSRRARVLSRLDLAAEAAASGAAARELADRLHTQVQSAATDGFVLRPDPAAAGRGLDAFVDRVVPLLQQRGSLRTAYTGTTLRDHLGLSRPGS
ncbi:LLM class flavin-dependent oxidoreductase [Streptomyces cocklensis]|uniref:Luciferase-like monooxygenase n=1 Tax=Actinacidiphila cocklensis TaxID=887465 RepID=A0A9W4DX16_9ACTN|nr:LLM class flavin-dependent oxidoreductase [Actinacidiphila cocklensis]WSX82256.1 LLM class flavin-dependent oxidoreductase [Streptomyces sp. NBC_00899]CAG6399150.1 Luciferase-like monooxygenase [Actinacidiphila cocklensis]